MYIDIAANLTDEMFDGIYNDKKKHECDRAYVVKRAMENGCQQMIVLAGTLNDAEKCLSLCTELDPAGTKLYTTIGFHPTRSQEAISCTSDQLVAFRKKAGDSLVAVGELGLDYDRLHFCPRDVQIDQFIRQLDLFGSFGLPFLFHLRNAFADFMEILQIHSSQWKPSGGVVHSFDGSRAEMEELVSLGLYIGLNGCSLRSSDFLESVVPHIPSDRLLLETDSPYCDVRPTHPGYILMDPTSRLRSVKPEKWEAGCLVKGRNEPCTIGQVAQVVAKVKGMEVTDLARIVRENTFRLFRRIRRI
jgi:TatD DNase family protein